MPIEHTFFYLSNIFLQTNIFSTLIDEWFIQNTNNLSAIIGSVIMGIVGSTAYLVASKLGFIKFNQNKKFQELGYGRAFGYAMIGGAVATVFQIPELPNFIPIQSFVLGITWPLLVAQYTSKTEPSSEKEDILKRLEWDK
ncbi:hypothetical protein C5F49_08875 [Nitrosopumilus oxyclinae]|uniref:Uncharacterized protein n=2 Tax=Nitrosopumilus oxyclinae TaxID=1959104 RepID=A0A7D5RC68_9ARCH|nr:hypothetical protein C5F49_08875 [Nitrosopumilus oxyclinae]